MNENRFRCIIREELSSFSAPQLLTAKEASAVLKVGESTLAHWRIENRGPDYIMVEGVIRYELSALHNYLNERRIES